MVILMGTSPRRNHLESSSCVPFRNIAVYHLFENVFEGKWAFSKFFQNLLWQDEYMGYVPSNLIFVEIIA